MRRPGRSALTSVSLGATAIVAGASMAMATLAPMWRFVPGGDFTGTNVGNIVIKDIDKGTSSSCSSSTATVTARPTWGSPTSLLTATGLTLRYGAYPDACLGPNNVMLKVTVLGLPWRYDAQGYSAGQATGRLVGVGAQIHGDDDCDFTVGGPGSTPGEVKVVYTNSTDRATLSGGNLVVRTADADCDPTLLAAGDRIEVVGTYRASPAQDIEYNP